MHPSDVIEEVMRPLGSHPAAIAGSVVAAEVYDLPLHDTSDVDVFCYTDYSLVTGVQKLLDANYAMSDRFTRAWDRWLKFGFRGWHTNSIKLHSPQGIETNLVFKKTGGQSLNSLSTVLESFDFGLLGTGYDLQYNHFRDMRPYLFPGFDLDGPLPLMPNKRDAWRNGFISQYNGLREPGRYAKYHAYGHDLSLVKDDLVTGYWQLADYMRNRGDADKIQMAEIYEKLAQLIQDDDLDSLMEAGRLLPTLDSFDAIMEALE